MAVQGEITARALELLALEVRGCMIGWMDRSIDSVCVCARLLPRVCQCPLLTPTIKHTTATAAGAARADPGHRVRERAERGGDRGGGPRVGGLRHLTGHAGGGGGARERVRAANVWEA